MTSMDPPNQAGGQTLCPEPNWSLYLNSTGGFPAALPELRDHPYLCGTSVNKEVQGTNMLASAVPQVAPRTAM